MQFPQRPIGMQPQKQFSQSEYNQSRNLPQNSTTIQATKNPHYLMIFLIILVIFLIGLVSYLKYSESGLFLNSKNDISQENSMPPPLPSEDAALTESIPAKDTQGSGPPRLP